VHDFVSDVVRRGKRVPVPFGAGRRNARQKFGLGLPSQRGPALFRVRFGDAAGWKTQGNPTDEVNRTGRGRGGGGCKLIRLREEE